MVPRRNPHTKSRNGCITCKTRRVKCDEQRPICGNCSFGLRNCSYQHPQSSTSTQHPTATATLDLGFSSSPPHEFACQPNQLPLPAISNAVRDPDRDRRREELYLMHYYSTFTVHTLKNNGQDNELRLWQIDFPREALKHEYLMDGLLMITSLHLAHAEPSNRDKHKATAMRYQSAGLVGFREALANMDAENLSAVFLFATLVVLAAFTLPPATTHGASATATDRLISIIELLRGVPLVIGPFWERVDLGIIKPVFQAFENPSPSSESTPTSDYTRATPILRERVDHIGKYVGPERCRVYHSAINHLDKSFRESEAHDTMAHIVAWPLTVGSELATLLQQADPMAQLIWIHYGVLFLHVQDRWWANGFGSSLVQDLSEAVRSVDEDWYTLTQWARDQVDKMKSTA
ncbi:hypothetical protein S7711_05916 [Stachybotrys chartarum IBT 7711]|uniref:Zn(2)-C6 fungal-type domain-containing protein n=1 Tax=Stachybotrys chartarum (strain CBS 109288 / IBT 7711) TaxID=1280523 RepID=A0A084B196_STACB|nr:hypothetical protein S7711_05916 [Stachybotrys chartarum IBT 7711]KFA51602.1 hypothetical protein S40293_03915 [Stachybotrys chartarum IBT 40293]